jgi:hypothetical protein
MDATGRPWLDEIEAAAEELRRHLGVSTLSVSRVEPIAARLETLVNAGILGPDEQRRPAAERYPLSGFPAARALVIHRRPYLFGPGATPDAASMAVQTELHKTSQAAAPLIVGGAVWGELWVASTAQDLPLKHSELPLLCWAAERFADTLAEITADVTPSAADEDPLPVSHRYHVWILGEVDPSLLHFFPDILRQPVAQLTVLLGHLQPARLLALLGMIADVGLDIVGVGRDDAGVPGPARAAANRIYELRFGSRLAPTLDELEDVAAVTVRQHGVGIRVRGRLDRRALRALLHHARLLDAELIDMTCRE